MNIYKIPVKLNLVVIIFCSFSWFGLLWFASRVHHYYWVLCLGVAFALIMVPVYSLMHEAAHNILFPNEKVNNSVGRWLCMMFIIPFSFFRHCHLKHHKKNRTDEEMWDLYYEHQQKWKRYGNLYGMMIGLGYLSLWLAVLIFAFFPRVLYSKFFYSHQEIAGFIRGSDSKQKIFNSRWESFLVIVFQAGCFYILDLKWTSWLTLYLIHGFLWSSQNYVNHAFSPRDIINGAHNLKVPFWLKPFYLNFNVHLAHHQNPGVPWLYLSRYIKQDKNRITFFKNYIRLWKGPVLTKEKNPTVSVILILILLTVAGCSEKKIIHAERKDIIESVYASGKIIAENEHSLFSFGNGTVVKKLVNDGDTVMPGQLLYEVNNIPVTTGLNIEGDKVKFLQQLSSNKTAENYFIRSDCNGVVFQTMKENGEAVRLNEPVILLGNSSNRIIRLQVDQQDIKKIKPLQTVLVKTDITGDTIYQGEVKTISPVMNEMNQTFRVDAVFKNVFPFPFIHNSLVANILISEKKRALVLPKYAIDGDSLMVRMNGKTEKIKIKTGINATGYIEIIGGIDENTDIVVNK